MSDEARAGQIMRSVSTGVMKAVSASLPCSSWEAMAVTIPTARRLMVS
ncbi:MAG TPA: hypothetical protein PKK68_05045 [Methanothrix soehngenii]|nr:hypothetical protein [Methanothrix soehngenii]